MERFVHCYLFLPSSNLPNTAVPSKGYNVVVPVICSNSAIPSFSGFFFKVLLIDPLGGYLFKPTSQLHRDPVERKLWLLFLVFLKS